MRLDFELLPAAPVDALWHVLSAHCTASNCEDCRGGAAPEAVPVHVRNSLCCWQHHHTCKSYIAVCCQQLSIQYRLAKCDGKLLACSLLLWSLLSRLVGANWIQFAAALRLPFHGSVGACQC